MRELKFRSWLKNYNCYADVLGFEQGRLFVQFQSGERSQHRLYVPIEDCILEQYTGLKDKNGKDIYEGDIVDVIFPTKLRGVEEHQIWVCRFGVKRVGFVLNRETNARIFSLTFGEINAKNLAVEVIGNIHENADLLEDKK